MEYLLILHFEIPTLKMCPEIPVGANAHRVQHIVGAAAGAAIGAV